MVSSTGEALGELKDSEEASFIAGGMAVVPLMRERIISPKKLVDISKISELAAISYDAKKGLWIGAAATHRQIEESPMVAEYYPSLKEAFHTIGNVRVRSVGTIGGNLAYAEPQCNPPAILAALGGQVHVDGPNGPRTIPAEDFIRGVFESALEAGEIITHVTVPPPKPRSASGFYKFTPRSQSDKPVAIVAVHVELDAPLKKLVDCRIVVGAVGPKAYRCFEAEKEAKKTETDSIDFAEVARIASQEFEVIEDINGPSWYKKQTTAAIIKDLLLKTVETGVAKGKEE